ncbi:MAG: hypothetical protein KDK99_16430 [Verrucomicrobiales bacterium]|nr:hypothetical protein [Verrucomicrobiales bacterium]
MKLRRLALTLGFSLGSLAGLVSCDNIGPVDSRYPTVSELDAMDVKWGMDPRKSRGAPSRVFNYDPNNRPNTAPPAAAAAAPMMDSTPPAAAPPIEVQPAQPAPSVPGALR